MHNIGTMRINKLPKSQVKALENAFRKSKDTREKIRFQALWLSARGYKRKEVAQITSSGESSIRHWITAYNKRSIGGLKSKPQTSHNYKLTQEQRNEVKKIITKKSPKDLGYGKKFWSIPLLRRLVKDKFKVGYKSKESYRRLFHDCGFTFHKPNKANKKQNPHRRKRFEDILKKNSNSTVEKIVWYW